MKRRTFLASLAVLPAAAAPPIYLPLFRAPPQAAVVTLVESDTTFVSAAHDPSTGRIYVSYIDRAHGNRLHLTELVQDRLVELEPPGLAQLQPIAAPAFVPPGEKEAASALLAFDAWLWLFWTARDEGDETGPFKLKLLRWRP